MAATNYLAERLENLASALRTLPNDEATEDFCCNILSVLDSMPVRMAFAVLIDELKERELPYITEQFVNVVKAVDGLSWADERQKNNEENTYLDSRFAKHLN